MTTQAHATLRRKMVQCEKKTVMLERIHDELRAARPSARIVRYIEKNRKVLAELAEKLNTARAQLTQNDPPPARRSAKAPASS